MNQKIFGSDLSVVDFCWRRYFWPDVVVKSTKVLQTYPNINTLLFPIKANRGGWKPAFMGSERKTRGQRVATAATWLKAKCPFSDERLRECLQLEIIPTRSIAKELYEGSRFSFEDEWDPSEFTEAFDMMRIL